MTTKSGREYFIVDAFTAEKYSGNPAAIVFLQGLEVFPAIETLQTVAREFNVPETAFIIRHSSFPLQFKIRWFTPSVEVPLCGHALLASAYVLYTYYNHPADQPIYFETVSRGLLTCSVETSRQGICIISMQFPLEKSQVMDESIHATTIDQLNAILRFSSISENQQSDKQSPTIKYIGTSSEYMLVEFDGIDIATIQPNFLLLKESFKKHLVITCRPSSVNCGVSLRNYDFISRVFAPTSGIDEDPVTGTSHCILAAYYYSIADTNKTKFVGYQASIRGGVVLCEVKLKDNVVVLRGSAVSVMQGTIL